MAVSVDVQMAVDGLQRKKRGYDLLWAYYDGDQPLVYSSEKLRDIFRGLNARFSENWCAVVVDSLLDRLDLHCPTVTNDPDNSALLADLWAATGMDASAFGVHEDVAVTGEAYVIAWPDVDGTPQAFQNDARMCVAAYDLEDPRQIRFAAKWWITAENHIRLTMYYADRLEYYETRRPFQPGEAPEAAAFEPMADLPMAANPFGRVPVFHFRSNRRRAKSQLANVIPIQDAVNKLLADMMVASEFGAYPQRYVISAAGLEPTTRNAPNEIWDLPAGSTGQQPTQAGQFAATGLNNYLDPINKLSADVGIISRTPRHYFFAQGGDPSGEALTAMEAPLVKKVKRLQSSLGPVWGDLACFLLEMAGVALAPGCVWAGYEAPETIQPLTQAQIRTQSVAAGMPLATVLKTYEGWTDEDILEMEQDRLAEQMNQQSYAAAVLAQAQTAFDQGQAQ